MSDNTCLDSAIAAFSTLEAKLPADADSTNPDSTTLAWTTSYILMGYLAMYRAQKDTAYLDTTYQYFQNMLANRDDVTGVEDQFRHEILPAWSTNHYTGGKEYCFIVHNGMITYPMMQWVEIIKSDPSLDATYGAQADFLIQKVQETVDAFDPDWRDGPGCDEGYYYGVFYQTPLPFNQQNAMARTLILLGKLTGIASYTSKATLLAQYFLNRMETVDDRYQWYYAPSWYESEVTSSISPMTGTETDTAPVIEDISHGAIDIEFVYEAYKEGIVFGDSDMTKYINTFKKCVITGGFSYYVDGTGDLTNSVQMGRWGHLAFYDQVVNVELCKYYTSVNWATGTTASFLASGYMTETMST